MYLKNTIFFTSSSISFGEVTTLNHEILDHPVEFAAFVTFTCRFFGQLHKIPHSLWYSLSKKTNFNPPRWFISNRNFKPYLLQSQ